MGKTIISYDLGTGGIKASLFDIQGNSLASEFVSYNTFYPETGWHEQRPADWWNAVIESTRKLISGGKADKNDIECLAISGHSLGVVPLAANGELLREYTPIWSDTRASVQAERFFAKTDKDKWYLATGNGFPAPCYSVFKIMWYKDNEPEMFKKVHKFVGTKDYINHMLTGKILTDFSYASGSGVYDLKQWDYRSDYIAAAGLDQNIFPEIVPSASIIGELTAQAADLLGLKRSVKVACGGVDNSCMALGARGFKNGRAYTSLGTSAWIAVTSDEPILNTVTKPYVFTHVVPGMFASAVCIFSAGNSLKWLRDTICQDLIDSAAQNGKDPFVIMDGMAASSPAGANKLVFNPSLAGGSSLEISPHIRGGFTGLDLKHTKADLIRSVLEGIALNLRCALDELKNCTTLRNEMLLVGGGSKSKLWRQIFADIFNMNIEVSNVGQDAGSLGAAALAAVGAGLWSDFEIIDDIHKNKQVIEPQNDNVIVYERILPIFKRFAAHQSEIGEMLNKTVLQ